MITINLETAHTFSRCKETPGTTYAHRETKLVQYMAEIVITKQHNVSGLLVAYIFFRRK
jgi:hypothetical protein